MVDGAAVGYGCDLALACDLRFCSDRARFGEVFVKRGLMPDGGGTFHLARLVGLGRALELMLTGEMVDAAEAHRIGLRQQARPRRRPGGGGARLPRPSSPPARRWSCARSSSTSTARSAADLDAALENEVHGQMQLLQSQDFFEGVTAFFQKRPPDFKGR